jgi:hypothetical protein
MEWPVSGIIRRVRVVEIKRGPKKTSTLLFYGRSDSLEWDPKRYQWNSTTPFMSYSAKLGRNILKRRHVVPNVVSVKWQGVLSENYRLRWDNTWNKERVRKEAGLIWLTWHRIVAVNKWRGRINATTPQAYRICNSGSQESILHRFWECDSAHRAWSWGIHILQISLQHIVVENQRR